MNTSNAELVLVSSGSRNPGYTLCRVAEWVVQIQFVVRKAIPDNLKIRKLLMFQTCAEFARTQTREQRVLLLQCKTRDILTDNVCL